MEDSGSAVPAIGISYSVQTADARSLVLQTHVPQDWTAEQINSFLDKLRSTADRQVEFGKLADLQVGIEQLDKVEQQLLDGIEAVDKKVEVLMRDGTIVRPNGAGAGAHQSNKQAQKNQLQAEEVARKNALGNLELVRQQRMKQVEKLEARRAELG